MISFSVDHQWMNGNNRSLIPKAQTFPPPSPEMKMENKCISQIKTQTLLNNHKFFYFSFCYSSYYRFSLFFFYPFIMYFSPTNQFFNYLRENIVISIIDVFFTNIVVKNEIKRPSVNKKCKKKKMKTRIKNNRKNFCGKFSNPFV